MQLALEGVRQASDAINLLVQGHMMMGQLHFLLRSG